MSFNDNVQLDPSRARAGGGGGLGGRGIALGGTGGLIALLIAVFAPDLAAQIGINPDGTIGGGAVSQSREHQQPGGTEGELASCRTGADANERSDCRVLATTEAADAYWEEQLSRYRDVEFRPPGLTLFTGSTQSGCGAASSDTGPFYCPGDESMYYDVSFFDTLERDFGAGGGPLAEQYIVAHEYGHHIQQIVGWLQYSQDGQTGPESGIVRVELQADCLAGMWAGAASETIDPESGEPFLEPITDEQLHQALDAAQAVGDDRIQQTHTGQVNPDSFTHGTSAQRAAWFQRGYEAGRADSDIGQCDTFNAPTLDI
ncbi:putative metalloprotease [Micrococcus cohnii]|uniref:Putative metalloprotease n=1 Tax=Micrococcus cohnii TaxID=993416 RepID=A0A7W7GN77_9MICC|nr:neutral zinc metallopeptidase [Micrococcus cohnii]MBB4735224.1 putative metalloprotease [Micrococcus cohnii]